MLVASLNGVREPAWTARRGAGHRCPACWEPVVLRRGAKVQPHFAHRPGATCGHGVGESERHRTMKRALATWLGDGYIIDFEVEVVRGRRADAVVDTPRGNRLVAEMQDSPLSTNDLFFRTLDYNQQDIPVLWVFSDTRLRDHRDSGEVRAPEEIRYIGDGLGGVWVSDARGRLSWASLRPPETRSSDWVEDGEPRTASYTPKTLRSVELLRVHPHPDTTSGHWRLVPTRVKRQGLDLISFAWDDGRRLQPITRERHRPRKRSAGRPR